MSFSEKAVSVTGATSGVGKAAARLFLGQGVRVAIDYRIEDERKQKPEDELRRLLRHAGRDEFPVRSSTSAAPMNAFRSLGTRFIPNRYSGLPGLTQTLALECADHGSRLDAVDPGTVDTNMKSELSDEKGEA